MVLGFRGEGLGSITSVGQLKLEPKTRKSQLEPYTRSITVQEH